MKFNRLGIGVVKVITLDSIVVWGLVWLSIGIVVLAAGIILLVSLAKSKIDSNKRMGRIIIGCFLVLTGIGTTAVSALFIHSREWISRAPTASDTAAMVTGISEALEADDPAALADLFAEEGYSGEALDISDAIEFFDLVDGDIVSTQFTVAGVSFEGMTHGSSYVYVIHTDSSDSYTVYFDFILASEHEAYVGIQHIELISEDQTLGEYGSVPELENHN